MATDQSPAPQVRKLDATIARLRLLLADLSAREAAADAQRRTCLDQKHKLVTFGMYGDAPLDTVLAMMADVDERLAHAETTARSLAAIRQRAASELESLQLTKGVEDAKRLLHELQERQTGRSGVGDGSAGREIQAEIARLQALINEGSERAAQSIGRRAR